MTRLKQLVECLGVSLSLVAGSYSLIINADNCPAPGFASALNYGVGTEPASVAAGDFNNDGKLDLAVANWGLGTNTSLTNGSVSVLIGNGDGTFQAATNYALGAYCYCVVVGDFNRDGKLDLATGGKGVRIMLGNGDGTFQASLNVEAGHTVPFLVAADFNHDGKLDLMAANNDSSNTSVLLGNGDGTFATALNHPTGPSPRAIAAGDFNGDTRLDAAVVSEAGTSVLLGNGNGSFQSAANYGSGLNSQSVATSDFNRDGRLDLALGNYFLVTVGLGNGDGTFQDPISFGLQAQHPSLAPGDFNGDGIQDLAVANVAPFVSIYLGFGDGTFQTWTNFDAQEYPFAVAVADFNGDGKPDLTTANYHSASASILLNTSPCSGPELGVIPIDSSIKLSWSYPSTGYLLESLANISATNWQPVAVAPSTNITFLEVTVPMGATPRFFRLHKP